MSFDDIATLNVFGHLDLLDAPGTPASGSVLFTPRVPGAFLTRISDSTAVIPERLSATFDENGDFTAQIPCTDDPNFTPVNWLWRAKLQVLGSPRQRKTFLFSTPVATPGGALDLMTVGQTVLPSAQQNGGISYVSLAQYNQLAAQVTALQNQVSAISPGGDAGLADFVLSHAGALQEGPGHGGYPVAVDSTIHSVIPLLTVPPVGRDAIFDVQLNVGPVVTSIFASDAVRPRVLDGTYISQTSTPLVTFAPALSWLTYSIVQPGLPTTEGSDLSLLVVLRRN